MPLTWRKMSNAVNRSVVCTIMSWQNVPCRVTTYSAISMNLVWPLPKALMANCTCVNSSEGERRERVGRDCDGWAGRSSRSDGLGRFCSEIIQIQTPFPFHGWRARGKMHDARSPAQFCSFYMSFIFSIRGLVALLCSAWLSLLMLPLPSVRNHHFPRCRQRIIRTGGTGWCGSAMIARVPSILLQSFSASLHILSLAYQILLVARTIR